MNIFFFPQLKIIPQNTHTHVYIIIYINTQSGPMHQPPLEKKSQKVKKTLAKISKIPVYIGEEKKKQKKLV